MYVSELVRDWIPGLNSMNPGAGHIIYFPAPGLPGLKFCWPGVSREPGRLDYIARDLENPGYPGCSAYLNFISRNMKYQPIKFTEVINLWKKKLKHALVMKNMTIISNHYWVL